MRRTARAMALLVSIVGGVSACGDDATRAASSDAPPPASVEAHGASGAPSSQGGSQGGRPFFSHRQPAHAATLNAPSFLNTKLLLGGASTTLAPLSAPTWTRRAGSTGDDYPMSAAGDASGNLFVTGLFVGTVDLGCGAMTATGTSALFLAKLNALGACTWSLGIMGTKDAGGASLAVATDGSVYVGGVFSGALTSPAMTSAGGFDGLVAKYSSAGVLQWSRRIGGAGDDYVNGVAVAGAELAVAGSFMSTVSFGGASFTSAGDADAFVADYAASNGAHQWSHAYGEAAYDAANAAVVDIAGNVWITGPFKGTASFGGAAFTSAGGYDGYFSIFDASGAPAFSAQFGGPGDDDALGVVVDPSSFTGRIVGYFQGSITFSANPPGPLLGTGPQTGFVVGYNSSGGVLWSRAMDAVGGALAEGVAVDGAGNGYVVGRFTGAGAADLAGAVSKGTSDMFLVKYDSSGVPTWQRTMGGVGASDGLAVGLTVGTRASVVAAGSFESSIDCGGGAITGAGGLDIALCAYAP